MKKKMTIFHKITSERKEQGAEQGAEGRQTLEPKKAHLTGEFVIVAKFGDHVLHRLASSLSKVIRQADKNSPV